MKSADLRAGYDCPPLAQASERTSMAMLWHHDALEVYGLENPATSLTNSACRVAPVFSNRLSTCVRTVFSEIPSALATSGMPPTSTMDKRTRNSVGVSRQLFAITSGWEGITRAGLR